jgi:3'(2'), 5'-bisphosphate nucleotidase
MKPNLLLEPAVQLAKQAGVEILKIYQQPELAIKTKDDKTPVTAADLLAHNIIIQGLKHLTPELPILSEESASIPFTERQHWQRYWLIDPLDGTKEFIEHLDDFTINIALIENHKPVLGVVHAPALGQCYFACVSQGAFKQTAEQSITPIKASSLQNSARVATSRRHGLHELQAFLQKLTNYTVLSRGSALKFALLAEGLADVYPRLSPTSEWDTAAGQCVVEQAGGAVIDCAGKPLRYNTKESLLNPAFLAVADATQNWLQYLK